MAVEFIDCTSLSISYDVMGIATVSYTIVADSAGIKAYDEITVASQSFDGYVTNVFAQPIPNTSRWWESHVTLVSTA
ncbi:MAG: hypothetical protein ACTSV7_06685 [Candidatus Baldrarchaeia archaeon]